MDNMSLGLNTERGHEGNGQTRSNSVETEHGGEKDE
jgi:hypothetical protein